MKFGAFVFPNQAKDSDRGGIIRSLRNEVNANIQAKIKYSHAKKKKNKCN